MADGAARMAKATKAARRPRRAPVGPRVDLRVDLRDRTEQRQRLIDEVDAEIEQHAATLLRRQDLPRLGLVETWAPALEARFVSGYLPQRAVLDEAA